MQARGAWVRASGSETRILSRRPLSVLGTDHASLQGLLMSAEKLLRPDVPRSQLRFLMEQLSRGKNLADLAFEELSPAASGALHGVGVKQVWTRSAPYLTSLFDLIEVSEIPRLGRAGQEDTSTLCRTSGGGS